MRLSRSVTVSLGLALMVLSSAASAADYRSMNGESGQARNVFERNCFNTGSYGQVIRYSGTPNMFSPDTSCDGGSCFCPTAPQWDMALPVSLSETYVDGFTRVWGTGDGGSTLYGSHSIRCQLLSVDIDGYPGDVSSVISPTDASGAVYYLGFGMTPGFTPYVADTNHVTIYASQFLACWMGGTSALSSFLWVM